MNEEQNVDEEQNVFIWLCQHTRLVRKYNICLLWWILLKCYQFCCVTANAEKWKRNNNVCCFLANFFILFCEEDEQRYSRFPGRINNSLRSAAYNFAGTTVLQKQNVADHACQSHSLPHTPLGLCFPWVGFHRILIAAVIISY